MSGGWDGLSTEHALSSLFGKKSTHGLANGLAWEDKAWRTWAGKTITQLRRYVDANVVYTDATHREQVASILELLDREVRGTNPKFREQALTMNLVRLCLLLLGDQPNHRERRAVNKKHFYQLDRRRTVHYSQTMAQRARVIFEPQAFAGYQPPLSDDEHYKLKRRYWNALRSGRFAKFVDWFRTTYPEQYTRLFA